MNSFSHAVLNKIFLTIDKLLFFCIVNQNLKKEFNMKKLTKLFSMWAMIFGILAFSLNFSACSDDSEEEHTPEETAKEYTITFNANDGSESPATTTQTFSATSLGTSVTLKANSFTREGYEFGGWSISADVNYATYEDRGTYTFYGDRTLYAVWELPANTCVITFDGNGGTTASGATTTTQRVSGSSSSYSATAKLDANPFTRSGYVFLGWSTSKDATTASYSDEYASYTVYYNTTLYAVWVSEASAITITLDANDGSGTTKTINTVQNQTVYLSSYTDNFSRDYATLKGWAKTANPENATTDYSLGSLGTSSFTATENLTLYAVWLENPKITFDANGGADSDGKTEKYQYLPGKYEDYALYWKFTPSGSLSVKLDENTFTREGYRFAGWGTTATSTSPSYYDKGTFTFTETTVLGMTVYTGKTLYAIWSENPKITYNLNGGSDDASFVETLGSDKAVTTKVPTAKYDYYTFAGWSTSSYASTAAYKAGDTINVSSNTTLYAVWKLGTIVEDKTEITVGSSSQVSLDFTLIKSESLTLQMYASGSNGLDFYIKSGSTNKYSYTGVTVKQTKTISLAAGTYKLVVGNENILLSKQATRLLKGAN